MARQRRARSRVVPLRCRRSDRQFVATAQKRRTGHPNHIVYRNGYSRLVAGRERQSCRCPPLGSTARIDFDGESSTVTPLTITAPSDAMADAVESLSGKTTQAALSPDGKTVALIAGNDVYVRDAEGNRPAVWSLAPKGEKKIQCGAPTATHCGLSLISPEPTPFTRPR